MTNPVVRAAIAAALALSPAVAFAGGADPAPASAYAILADLTTEVGQRLAGSPREAAARDWAVARLTALGFSNVRAEPFTIKGFVRGAESARLTSPAPHQLHVTALGYSMPTPPGGLEAELVYFPSLEALEAAPAGSLAGKITFIDNQMRANQDGSGYGPYGNARRQGPGVASAKGALAVVIRSAGTDHNRDPHTGVIDWQPGARWIPAGAVSAPDADLIARIAGRGKPMKLSLVLEGHPQDGLPSGNVIADLPGRDPALPPILVGCHLDSWDLGTGAVDDGAGCAIVTAAALQASRAGQLRRTVRVLWAGSEEVGGFGGEAYAKAHGKEPHALVMESDFGADRIWRLATRLAPENKALADRVAAALAPLGVVRGSARAGGGSDVEQVAELQHLAVIDLNQDGTRYFDLHHTPDDTFDKVDPAMLQQNVDCWAAVLKVVAEEAGPISPVR